MTYSVETEKEGEKNREREKYRYEYRAFDAFTTQRRESRSLYATLFLLFVSDSPEH